MELIEIIRISLEIFTITSFIFVITGYVLFKIKHPGGLRIPIKIRSVAPLFLEDRNQTNLYFRIKYLEGYKLLNGRISYNNHDKYSVNNNLFNSYYENREQSSGKNMYKPKAN